MTIEIYPYRHGVSRKLQYGWTMYAVNGEVMCGNKGFNTPDIAKRSIKLIRSIFKKDEFEIKVVEKHRKKRKR